MLVWHLSCLDVFEATQAGGRTFKAPTGLGRLQFTKSENMHTIPANLRSLAIASTLILATATTQAAPITWLNPVAFNTSGSALNQAGSVVSAFSSYGNISASYGSGSVAFSGLGSIGGAMSFSGYQGQTPSGSNVANYTSAANPAFGQALSSFLYDGWQAISLNNLVAGHQYAVQLFSIDNRSGFTSNNEYYVDAYGNSSAKFLLGSDSFVIGTFTADTTSELVYVHSDYCHGSLCTGQSAAYRQTNEMTNVNAVVLRDTTTIPEPWMPALVGVAAILALSRSRRC